MRAAKQAVGAKRAVVLKRRGKVPVNVAKVEPVHGFKTEMGQAVNANCDGKNKKNHDNLERFKPPKNGDIDVCDYDSRKHQQPVESVGHN